MGKERNIAWSFVLGMVGLLSGGTARAQYPDELKIWFSHPASHWNEALPVGNGRLGAMVFGGVQSERLQLNEQTVWAGRPADFVNPEAKRALPAVRAALFAGKYKEAQELAQQKLMGNKTVWSAYQTLGDLWLHFDSLKGEVTDYHRELDLETAVAKVSYRANHTLFAREVFSSAPDQALVIRLTASKRNAISFSFSLNRPGGTAFLSITGDEILMQDRAGNGTGVRLAARVKVLQVGGTVSTDGQAIRIQKADTVTLLLTAATDYRGEDALKLSGHHMAEVGTKTFNEVKRKHIEDYQTFFKRVELNLGRTEAAYFPTDARLKAVQKGNMDPHLIALYYQFGRYLLISSSRPGGLPANLQGIWADGLTPPWEADYHINVNIQMNYWPAEITNLPEMHLPFLHFINALLPDGRKTARDMYGMKGAVAHFTTDAWLFTETYGQTGWAMWPMGLAWSTRHLWEHYLFTGNKAFLAEKGYPAMKEAARFCMDWLVKNPVTKKLVSGPSISPENTFQTKEGEVATMVMGPTMDHMIIRDLLTNTIAASKVLESDAVFRKRLQQTLANLSPTGVGHDGRIMEWTEEFEEPEPGHRHISHLYGLYPGNEITKKEGPQLLEAARKTIHHRLQHGGGHTGWSRAWIINFFARLEDGQAAYQNLIALLTKSTLPNLFDNHPPFQIDGNFGATAGITEMLLQSHAGDVHLLPALPPEWRNGYIKGVMARGGFEVDINWKEGALREVEILSKLGNPLQLRYKNKTVTLKTEKGKAYFFNEALQQLNSNK